MSQSVPSLSDLLTENAVRAKKDSIWADGDGTIMGMFVLVSGLSIYHQSPLGIIGMALTWTFFFLCLNYRRRIRRAMIDFQEHFRQDKSKA